MYSNKQEDIDNNFLKPPVRITPPKKKPKTTDKRLKNDAGELININKTKVDIEEAMENVVAAEHIFNAAVKKAKKALSNAKTIIDKITSSLPEEKKDNKQKQNVEIVAIDGVARLRRVQNPE